MSPRLAPTSGRSPDGPGLSRHYQIFKAGAIEGIVVQAGDGAPVVTGGYAKFMTVDRPQRTGLNVFSGYDPITITFPIVFEAFLSGQGEQIEDDIATLERLAGRGVFKGAGASTPPAVNVQVTDAGGDTVPLLPKNYQYDPDENTNPPDWFIAGLDWDDHPIRNDAGNRIRQACTVTLTQRTVADTGLAATKSRKAAGSRLVHSTDLLNTLHKIAHHWQASDAAIKALNAATKDRALKRALRDMRHYKLPAHTVVRVPK
jgi:hypothetical protein